ncbi:MAG: hypothetical protein R8G33_02540 [Gammaproteobacteria bacterium]|nr:hypothetical protein [Gammaproteobacteria bacterium]
MEIAFKFVSFLLFILFIYVSIAVIASKVHKYRTINRLSKMTLGDNWNFIQVTTAIVTKINQPTKEKGLYIYATKPGAKAPIQYISTIPITEQEIENTIEACRTKGLASFTWGKSPVNRIIMNEDQGELILQVRRLYFYKLRFVVKMKSTTFTELENAFKSLNHANASTAIEA